MDLGTTAWTNPTDSEVRLRLFLAIGQFETFKIPPRETVAIPSQFTTAIQVVRDGQVVGGLAPQLVREGQTEKLHPVLAPTAEKPASRKS